MKTLRFALITTETFNNDQDQRNQNKQTIEEHKRVVCKGINFRLVRVMLTMKVHVPNAWRLLHLPSNYDNLYAPTARLDYQLRDNNFINIMTNFGVTVLRY